jgi:hypothetical protein
VGSYDFEWFSTPLHEEFLPMWLRRLSPLLVLLLALIGFVLPEGAAA